MGAIEKSMDGEPMGLPDGSEFKTMSSADKYFLFSQPFKSPDVANAAIDAFRLDVESAREKYGIADVLVIVRVPTRYPDGLGTAETNFSWGDVQEREAMAARALGAIQAERRAMINKLLAGGK